jgi:hypothetical protein
MSRTVRLADRITRPGAAAIDPLFAIDISRIADYALLKSPY